jgi:hypothetical protein
MGIRTRNNSQAEAQKRFRRAQEAWQANQPRRCETNIVGGIGECLACDAEQGVACQSTRRNGPVLREGV